MDLYTLFFKINRLHFDSFLEAPFLRFNPRLRTQLGRFLPGRSPQIEIASTLLTEEHSAALIYDTLLHEIIHYWLWIHQRPYGHTPEFYQKMKETGAKRYHSLLRTQSQRYQYQCPMCYRSFFAPTPIKDLACATCCHKYTGGHYHQQFQLIKMKSNKI